MANGKQTTAAASGGATLGFEKKLWDMADALRNNMDAAEYKHVVLGLIFLKYISDAFEAQHAKLDAEIGEGARTLRTQTSTQLSASSGVPPSARWEHVKAQAPQPTIGEAVGRGDGRH